MYQCRKSSPVQWAGFGSTLSRSRGSVDATSMSEILSTHSDIEQEPRVSLSSFVFVVTNHPGQDSSETSERRKVQLHPPRSKHCDNSTSFIPLMFEMLRARWDARALALLVCFSGISHYLPAADAAQLPEACLQAAQVIGPCRAAWPRWSYDAESMACVPSPAGPCMLPPYFCSRKDTHYCF